MRKLVALFVIISALVVVSGSFGRSIGTGPSTAEAATWQTSTVTWGPYTIPAGGEQKNYLTTDNCFGLGGILLQLLGGTTCVNRSVPLPCTNCSIGAITPNLVYADGSVANFDTGPMLHHMVVMSRARGDLSCPKNLFGGPIQQLGALMGGNERIFASGNERTVMDITGNEAGYRINSGDKWMLITDLMNMSSSAKTVYLQFTFKYTTNTVSPVKPLWLDIDNCKDSELATSAGYTDTHKDWKSTISGTVLKMGGHGHGEAIATAVQNVSTGAYYCTSVAGYMFDSMEAPAGPGPGTPGHPANTVAHQANDPIYMDPRTMGGMMAMDVVESQTVCSPNMTITAGQTMRIHQTYNSMASDPDNMGIMVGFIK